MLYCNIMKIIFPGCLFTILAILLFGFVMASKDTESKPKQEPELRNAHYVIFLDDSNKVIWRSRCSEGLDVYYDKEVSAYRIKMYRKLKGGWFIEPDETQILKVKEQNYSYKKVSCDK